jgi:lysophospholipase L1-like esterase
MIRSQLHKSLRVRCGVAMVGSVVAFGCSADLASSDEPPRSADPERATLVADDDACRPGSAPDALAGCVIGPADQTVFEGQPATFRIAVGRGAGPVTYQWLRGGVPIPVGATSAGFTTFPTTLLDDGATFQVRVTSANGAVTSNAATLSLRPSFEVNPQAMSAATHTFIAANDPDYAYVGRIDRKNPAAPVLIWSGTTVKARFHGKSLGIQLNSLNGNNYFTAIVDGEARMLTAVDSGRAVYQWNGRLADTDHELTLFKRTEAMFSFIAFEGLLIDRDQRALRPRPRALPRKIEFYGDSITAGAIDEVFPYDNDGDTYNPIGYSAHNNYTAYGAITARNIDAEYVAIACSGIGVSVSWNDPTMPDVYDRLYYKFDVGELRQDSNRYDFSTERSPDIVVINLGVNDFGRSNFLGNPFPADYVDRYLALVANLRALRPRAAIVLTLGGLSTGSSNGQAAVLMDAFTTVVSHFTTGATRDPNLYGFVFHATNSANPGIHPRDYTHQLLADELTRFLKDNHIVR